MESSSFYIFKGGIYVNIGVNSETRKRTLLAIAAVINDAILPGVILIKDNYGVAFWIYFALSIIANIITVWVCTYYNNDYTPEGETGTMLARAMKEHRDNTVDYNDEPEDSEVSHDN